MWVRKNVLKQSDDEIKQMMEEISQEPAPVEDTSFDPQQDVGPPQQKPFNNQQNDKQQDANK